MKKSLRRILAVILSLSIIMTMFTCLIVFGQTTLIKQYTFENGMPKEFTPLSYDGSVSKPKIVNDDERGKVLRQYFGVGTGYGNGDPLGESYVDISENPYSNVNVSNGVTFMLWVKTEGNAAWDYNDTILSFNNSTVRFTLNDAPYLNYNKNETGEYFNAFPNEQQSIKGKWLHYAFTISNSEIRIFINGVQVGSYTDGNIDSSNAYTEILDFISNENTSLNLGLGGYFGSQDCYMDDIRFYNGIMPDDDIYNIYDTTVDYTTRNSVTISRSGVHDPSIVACYTLADGTQVGADDPRAKEAVSERWWIFGSHLGSAYSDDLINWHNYSGGFDTNNPLMNYTDENGNFIDYYHILGERCGCNDYDAGMWAACVIWNVDLQKWCMYGSCVVYDSTLWVAYSDKIEGPYTDAEPIVYSNPADYSTAQSYIASVCPNGAGYSNKSWWKNSIRTTHTVDPTTFYDKDGNMWMIYGSYNSLFILPMDETTGLPDYEESYQRETAATNAGKNNYSNNDWYSDWYWGTRINYTNVATDYTGEGAYIYYDNDTNYYYLYITYGGFADLGGYNLRVFRSENPEGPYTDELGTDICKVLDTDSTEVNGGVKITGNYQWECNSVAYMSPGHDSVLQETVDGVEKIFQMYHVRFNNKSEGFYDQLHQMARTKDGWTVMLPYEYYGETIEYDREYSVSEIAGAYEFIDLKNTTYHLKDESDYDSGSNIVLPTQHIVLTEDGKIYGVGSYKGGTTSDFSNSNIIEKKGIIGTWSEDSGSCYASFEIDGVTYSGLFTYQYDESKTKEKKLVFAATGNNATVWGSKITSNSYQNTADTSVSLLKQVTVDNGEISDSSINLYGNAAVVNDSKRNSVLFLPEGDEGWATIDNPYYNMDNLTEATISFWGKVTQQADYDGANIFMSFINDSSAWQYFTFNSGVQSHIFYKGYADFYTENPPSYTYDAWHYYALTIDSNEKITFYIDGIKVGYATNKSDDYDASANSILEWLTKTDKIYLSKTQSPVDAVWQWTGQECYMDNICFYEGVLTSNQIMKNLFGGESVIAANADESIADISIDPVVYTHGSGNIAPYMYAGNIISHGDGINEKITYLHIPDEYSLLSVSSDNGLVDFEESRNGYYLTGTVNSTNTDMALTLYLSKNNKVYVKTVYAYVLENPVDAHVVEWCCIKTSSKYRSLCHVSRLEGSTGSGATGNFQYLDNPAGFNDASDSAAGMKLITDGDNQKAGAYAYKYTSLAVAQTATNDVVPTATYYIDKSNSDLWNGSSYTLNWKFTTINGNSSAIKSDGRSVSASSSSSAISIDTSEGIYDDNPNVGGVSRTYYVTGSQSISDNTMTVKMTQGSTPKATANHKINLTVNLYDKSLVRNALEEYDKYYEGAYSADSWQTFEAARRNAYAYLNNYKNTDDSQTTQQSIINALSDAVNQLEVIDYSQLEKVISDAKVLNSDNYTTKSFAALEKSLAKCEALIGCASSQNEVDKAAEELSGVMGELVRICTFSGRVTTTAGDIIPNAEIKNNDITIQTDDSGEFSVKLENGKYKFTVSADSSFDREITVVLNGKDIYTDISILNCNLVDDGYINAKDYAEAMKTNNESAQREIAENINEKKSSYHYDDLIFA